MTNAKILSISSYLPAQVRRNEWFCERAPNVFEAAQKHALAQVFEPSGNDPATRLFDTCAAPYMNDPFRGTVERRALGDGETVRSIERDALLRALNAAALSVDDIDLLICVSFRPEEVSPGNAAYIANELGSRAAVMNIEATCSGTFMALQTAMALIESGAYNTVAVATSCTYSRDLDLQDSLAWFLGDAAGAIILAATDSSEGVMGSHVISTTHTCGAFRFHPCGTDSYAVGVGDFNGGPMMRSMAVNDLQLSTDKVLAKAGLQRDALDFLVINTPLAWMAELGTRALGLSREQTVCSYRQIANVGPALTSFNLWKAASEGRLKPGDLVLLHGFGTVSNSGAMLIRWGDTAVA